MFSDDKIIVGQSLFINKEKRYIDVNGYVYTNINFDTLNATLPYLTYLSIFSYSYDEFGKLINLNDIDIVNIALKANVEPLLVLTNIKPSGTFDSDWAHKLLINNDMQKKLLDNVLNLIKTKGYKGINIDFEYVYPSDRELYNLFLVKVVNLMHQNNLIVTTALAPKTSDNQVGLLYEAIDYAFHGKIIDRVILMTYEWGYKYGPPMAVAPLNQVEKVLKYAVSVIPSQKILMGIPNYGYDWTVPYEKGQTAKTISNTDALALAKKTNSVILFDELAQTPYFKYNNNTHEVWFEDARSIKYKLDLVKKYNLGGISYWNLTNFFTSNFKVLEETYNIAKN